MDTRFLLGPAGSGKTWRCLAEIRAALRAAPDGLPLVLLAPKQATFQLERQLLADPALAGFTRLRIFSFERLAEFVLDELGQPPSPRLSEEGRLMVLRALLARKQRELKLFHASARLPGFARQLSLLLRELQRYQLAPDRLLALTTQISGARQLGEKLHDLALLLRAYLDWLRDHRLEDVNGLPDLATRALRSSALAADPARAAFQLGGLWLDGFAEMTPQELDLLAALVPHCTRATLAFCLENEPRTELSWLSAWSVVSQTFRRCHQRLADVPGNALTIETLARDPGQHRFAGQPVLQHLERHWTTSPPPPFESGERPLADSLRAVRCTNPEAEAVFAARTILRFVRDERGRFRDTAVLLRSLDGYADALRRVFERYEIPFFLDRRESAAHHPLAELTRCALRTVAFDWRPDDWFGALKTGLVNAGDEDIDALENEALARGWAGALWRKPLPDGREAEQTARHERVRQRVLPPFEQLAAALALAQLQPTGAQLAAALRNFWRDLDVETQLEAWRDDPGDPDAPHLPRPSIHLAVWEQLQDWLDNVARAFPDDALPLRDWLPILDTGLAGLTVGVVPPALDQVVIGALDRSRNPDLELALVLGANASVFPAPPGVASLLTEAERAALADVNAPLGASPRQQLGHERYYGYIACTRARRRLVLTCAERDTNEAPLNPSPFLDHLQRLFPALTIETAPVATPWPAAEHVNELVAPLLESQTAARHGQNQTPSGAAPGFEWFAASPLARLPALAEPLQRLGALGDDEATESLTLAAALYPDPLRTSVSRLEKFAACPFQFFVHSGLRADERKTFESDDRERGSFQHEVLRLLQEELRGESISWHTLTDDDARARLARLAARAGLEYRDGLFHSTPENRFTARSLTAALQNFVTALLGWMPQYCFEPCAAELVFDTKDAALPAWRIELDGGRALEFRGRIDRVDLALEADPDGTACVVYDYKSSSRKIDPVLLAHGVQLQLPAYLAALRQIGQGREVFGGVQLKMAGAFYVNLRGEHESGKERRAVLDETADTRRGAYQHRGLFDVRDILKLDARPQKKNGSQFKFRLTEAGKTYANDTDPMPSAEFSALLDQVEAQLRDFGRRIFAGEVRVDPYRKGQDTPCTWCDYRPICRIDPWTHSYRVLRKPENHATP